MWPSLALCAVCFWRRRVGGGLPVGLLGAAFALTLGLSFMAYVLTPVDNLQWHLDTSLKRLLLQLTPLAMAWACAGIGLPGSRERALPRRSPA